MKKLTEAEAKLFADLGLPDSIAYLAPEACTCGLHGCTEHQSWGDRVTELIFKDLEGTGDGTVIDLAAQMEMMKNFKFPDNK